MASGLKFDLGFEISYLNYPGIHVHIASNCYIGGLLGYCSLPKASEVNSDLGIQLCDVNYI